MTMRQLRIFCFKGMWIPLKRCFLAKYDSLEVEFEYTKYVFRQ